MTLTTCPHTAWEETGAIPDCEDLKIHSPAGTIQSQTPSRPTRVLRKKRVKTTHDVRPADLLEEDSDTTPGQGANAEVSNSPNQTVPSTGNNQAQSSTENPGLTQNPNDQSSSAVPKEPAQGQAPPPSSNPPQDTAVDKTVPASNNPPVPNATSNTSSVTTGQTSENPPPDPSNQPDPSNPAVPSVPPNPNTSGDTDHQNSSGNDNGTQGEPQPSNASQSSTPTNTNLTVLLNLDARIEIITMQQNENKTKANWQKYQAYWASLSSHIKFRAESMQNITPIKHDFHFQRTSCSYASWIKTISSLGKSHQRNTMKLYSMLMIFSPSATDFLGPTTSDPWFCPDVINFPALCSYANKEKEKAPHHEYIPISAKSTHPETNLVRFLHRLYRPPPTAISNWAKVVAASVELMADNLYMPPPPDTADMSDHLVQGVQILKHLDSLKNSSTFDTTDNNPAPNMEVVERPHSSDVLHDLRNVIIDIFMGYIILQTHALSSRPLTNTEKKKTYRQTRTSARKANNTSQALIQPANTTTEIARIRDESSQQLQTLQTRHNFQPLTFFLVGGVRGLLVVSRDYRNGSLSDCMSFTQAISIIKKFSRTPRMQEEPIWKNLSAYLVELFQPSFLSPDKIVPLTKPPTRQKLAEAITNDFLNHWRQLQPTSPFLIPHSTRRQITDH